MGNGAAVGHPSASPLRGESRSPLAGRVAFGFLLLLCALSAWAQVAVPELSRRVTDLTATLDAAQVAALEGKLAAFEAQKGSQIAVLIVPTTQPEDIAQFGIRVAEQWKIGRAKVDDGVILIVAKNDRTLRLEVGYGLEGRDTRRDCQAGDRRDHHAPFQGRRFLRRHRRRRDAIDAADRG